MGGLSGHMQHPIDVLNFTRNDLKCMIGDLFNNKIQLTEKVDGFNIHASKDINGNLKLFRNSKDLENGGMSIEEMVEKYKDKQNVLNVFLTASVILIDFVKKLDENLKDPDDKLMLTINCECVSKGVTNIMYYDKTIVYIHNVWVWHKIDNKWVIKEIIPVPNEWKKYMNCCLQITPTLEFEKRPYDDYISQYYFDSIDKIFGGSNSILEYYQTRFLQYIIKNNPWVLEDHQGTKILFNRFILNDKSTNLKELKKIYKDNDIDGLCKVGYKEIVQYIKKDIDNLFLSLGNEIISRTKGYINESNQHKAINLIKSELSILSIANKLNTYQMERLNNLNNIINPMEGVTFTYKDRLLKLTGSFAPINQLIGGQY